MPESIQEHIRIAQHIMRSTANDLDNYATYNEAGRRYLLESAMKRATDMYQRVFAAKVQHDNKDISTRTGITRNSPCSEYYSLFAHMLHEHGLVLTDSELAEIVRVVRKSGLGTE